jgi:hypothetical protein
MWQTNEYKCVDEIETCCVTVSNVLFLWRYSFGHLELGGGERDGRAGIREEGENGADLRYCSNLHPVVFLFLSEDMRGGPGGEKE